MYSYEVICLDAAHMETKRITAGSFPNKKEALKAGREAECLLLMSGIAEHTILTAKEKR